MATQTYDPLATITLAASASEVNFNGIDQSYRDLVLVVSGTITATKTPDIVLNGDTGNKSQVIMYANGSIADSSTTSNLDFQGSTGQYNSIIQAMDYSATDKHKTFLSRSANADIPFVRAQAGRWASTAAITSITLKNLQGDSDFNAGSTFTLYGVL